MNIQAVCGQTSQQDQSRRGGPWFDEPSIFKAAAALLPALEGSLLALTFFLTVRRYPAVNKITILLGSEKINAFYHSVPIAYIFPTRCHKGHCYFSARLNAIRNSNCNCNSVKGKGGGLPTPPAPMQTYGTWLIGVLQREGWPAAKHIAKGLSSSC